MNAESGERREVCYRGRVQGVGFRFTVRGLAAGYQVGGFVKNLPDGTVRLVAEGSAAELDRFLEAVTERMRDYIRESHTNTSPATGEFRNFSIEH